MFGNVRKTQHKIINTCRSVGGHVSTLKITTNKHNIDPFLFLQNDDKTSWSTATIFFSILINMILLFTVYHLASHISSYGE